MTPPAPPWTPERLAETKALCEAATEGPWAWGRLIVGQAGDYVIWRHRGDLEGEPTKIGYSGKGPQRTYVGNVGGMIQPVIQADETDVIANQVFEADAADAAFIAAARTALPDALAEIERLTAQVRLITDDVRLANAGAEVYAKQRDEAEARWEALKAWGERARLFTLSDMQAEMARLEREPSPAREDTTRCPRMSPPEWTEHWREWHRGHGCELDPDVKRSQP